MRTSISLLFRIRKPKNYKSGQFPIYLRITVDGQRCEIAMSRQLTQASGVRKWEELKALEKTSNN